MIARHCAAAAVLVLAALSPLAGQLPHSLGTAAALGDAAVTDARRADAVLWNPALVGIYDGPLSSYSILGLELDAVPPAGWGRATSALGLDGNVLGRLSGPGAAPGGAAVGQAAVRWLATQHRDLAVSISSAEIAAAELPDELSRALGAEAATGPLSADSAMRLTYTVAALTRALNAGRLPVLGDVWLGVTGKGWLVHSYARGRFRGDAPREDVYRETLIRDVPGYGLDLGLLVQPYEQVRVGVALSNAFTATLRPSRGPRVREVGVVELDGGYEVVEATGPHLGSGDEDTEEGRMAAALWESLTFPTVLRAGASVETGAGSLAASWRATLRSGGLDAPWEAAPYTVAFAGSARLPVRGSYSFGADSRTLAVGVRLGPCERQWVASVVRRSGTWGSAIGGTASVTLGTSGCDRFRS